MVHPYGYVRDVPVNLKKPAAPFASGLNGAIAAQLRAERAALEMTVEEFGEFIGGVGREVTSRYLNGKREIPLSLIEAVAVKLKVPASELVRAAEDRAARGVSKVVADGGVPDDPRGLEKPRQLQTGPRHGLEDLNDPGLSVWQREQVMQRAGIAANDAADDPMQQPAGAGEDEE